MKMDALREIQRRSPSPYRKWDAVECSGKVKDSLLFYFRKITTNIVQRELQKRWTCREMGSDRRGKCLEQVVAMETERLRDSWKDAVHCGCW